VGRPIIEAQKVLVPHDRDIAIKGYHDKGYLAVSGISRQRDNCHFNFGRSDRYWR